MNNLNQRQVSFDNLPKVVADVFLEVKNIKQQLVDLVQQNQFKAPEEYLTRNEVSKLFKCDLSTVHNWSVKGKLIKYVIGDKVFYKRSELEEALKKVS